MFNCPTPHQLEYFWQSQPGQQVNAEWQAHLKSCPNCRRLTEEHTLTRKAFAAYRQDSFFGELANWQPDLTALEKQNPPVDSADFELVPFLPEAPNFTTKTPVKFRPVFWGTLAAGLVVGLVGVWLFLLTTPNPAQLPTGAVPTATPAPSRQLIFDAVVWADAAGQDRPAGITVSPQGLLYFSDAYRHRISSLNLALKEPVSSLQSWGSYGTQEGQLKTPQALVVTEQGAILVADTVNHRIQKFDSSGQFLQSWGSYGAGDTKLNNPQGIALAPNGSVVVADTDNHRIVVYNQNGNYLSSFGEKGAAFRQFDQPKGVALDKAGNIYVADSNNRRIQKFDSAGQFIQIWGEDKTAGGQFSNLLALALDKQGSLYVLDGQRIQKFDSAGRLLVMAQALELDSPQGIAADNAGNVYVTDTRHSRVVKFRSY